MIDDSDPNGVWVRFSRPPESLRFSEIIVDLHEAEKEVIGNKLQQMVVPMVSVFITTTSVSHIVDFDFVSEAEQVWSFFPGSDQRGLYR